jgi:hypothetical protein
VTPAKTEIDDAVSHHAGGLRECASIDQKFQDALPLLPAFCVVRTEI